MLNIDTTLTPMPLKADLIADKERRRKMAYYYRQYEKEPAYMRYKSSKSTKRYNERQRWLRGYNKNDEREKI